MGKYDVNIFRDGKIISTAKAESGKTLLEVISSEGIFLDAPCGGKGRCKKCKVRTAPSGEEVLACQTRIAGPMNVYLPEEMKMTIGKAAAASEKAVRSSESSAFGVAVDIGTTTVVAHLIDMRTGQRLATASDVNAQRQYGADVISRIQYSIDNGHETLTRLIRNQIAKFIRQTCQEAGVKQEEVKELSIAGNTVMEHLFAGLSPVGMGLAPFTTESLFGEEIPAGDDLPVAKDAKIYMAPAVASYVGGDITAGMLAAGLEQKKNSCLYLDIGTNGEIAIKSGDKYYCCATAAGPAFEGAEIAMGMAAVPGAISYVKWTGDRLALQTIGDAPAKGLCGSGLIDALAVLLITGAVDETGRLLDAKEASGGIKQYLGKKDGQNVFYLTPDVYMTSRDVRKLQLAKAAIAAGIQTVMHHAGLASVSEFLLAGGFGSYLNQESAAQLGMFPKAFLPVTKVVGNTAGEGAILALYSPEARKELSRIRERCDYIELSDSAYFMGAFVDQMMFED